MGATYTIAPLEWSGKITFEEDGYPAGIVYCENCTFSISGNSGGYDHEAQVFIRPSPEEKYILNWSACDYYDEDYWYFRTIKDAKEKAWEYWVERLKRSLIEVAND